MVTSRTVDVSPPNPDVAAGYRTIHCRLFPDDRTSTVVVEDLQSQVMTCRALGTAAVPSINVKAKTGLNRQILATGRSRPELRLDFKCGHPTKVNPASTSQTCAICDPVHRDNRPAQAAFASGAGGHRAHADHKAAVNTQTRWSKPVWTARGTRVSAWREAFPPRISTIREHDVLTLFHSR